MAQLRIFLSHSSTDRDFADALNSLQRYTEALQAAEQALTLEPQSAIGWQRKAALRGLGRTKEAEEAEARAKALGG